MNKLFPAEFDHKLNVGLCLSSKSSVVCDMTPCGPLKVNGHFRRTCRFYFQNLKVGKARNQNEAGSKRCNGFRFSETSAVFYRTT
jgi:hypothetical protein